MNFLYPEFLWALSVLIIPIVIHLFNFKKYKTVYFSSLKFIKHVDEKTRSTQQLKHLLVLLSRLLAFTFVILAFARPYSNKEEAKQTNKNGITCFYIDNSFSMQARGPEGELLSEAREKAKEIIEKSPRSIRFLIGTNEMSGREERLLNRREALEKIDQIELSPLSRSFSQIVQWQKESLVKAQNNETNLPKTNYFIFSDFQLSKETQIAQDQSNIVYYPTRLIPESENNIYIDSAWFTSPIHRVGTNKELNIRIVSLKEEDVENLELTIQIGDYNKTVFVNAAAGQKTTTNVHYADKTTGFKTGKITVADEHIFFDDDYFFSYEVQENTAVTILNGEDAVTGAHMIYEINDYYLSNTKQISAVTIEDFQQQDLIVINGANNLSSGLNNYILEFTKSGGSVILFPGKNPERSSWNQLLEQLKLPLIGPAVSSGNRIKTLNYADPFYEGVFEKQTSNLNLPSVSKTFRAIKSNVRSTDLITLQNGLPLLSYAKNNGNSLMFYSSIHEDFGSFTNDALFTTILLRSAELAKRQQPIAMTIGKSAQFPIYKKISEENPIHLKAQNIDLIPQKTNVGGVNYISLNQMDDHSQLLAGNYTIETDKNIGTLSLNYNRIESNTKYQTQSEIEKVFGQNSYKYNEIGAESELSTADINKPFSYWKLCIVLSLIFVFSEMLIVRLLK